MGDQQEDPPPVVGGPLRRADPESALSRTQEAERTRSSVAKLSEPRRSIVAAYYLYEVPVGEIAEAMGLPVNTVKSHLHRGRKAVRKMLEESREV